MAQESRGGADALPQTQVAIQLTGPDQLTLNAAKAVPHPTGRQVLGRVEATGLCFSDLKLLKQFSDHPRKSAIAAGIDPAVVNQCPSYVPGDLPTVPGHETVIRIVAVGDQVRQHQVGERCLVQSDYRGLPTEGGSNAAFGYNFEGGLQEYVIVEETVSQDHETGERLLIPVGEERCASALGLVEPWACVEDSYASDERRTIKPGGAMLVVAEAGQAIEGLADCLAGPGQGPASVTLIVADAALRAAIAEALAAPCADVPSLSALEAGRVFDDILYAGADRETLEILNGRLASGGIINVVTGGKKIGAPVAIGVGRMHYGLTRWVGTTTTNAAEGYAMIPANGELRPGDSCLVVGAGGPMGQMHVIRNICSGIAGLTVVGTDFDDERLESLEKKAAPLADKWGVGLRLVNTQKTALTDAFRYVALMAPVAPLVAQAIAQADTGCIVNIFAGIPAPTIHPLDLDRIIEKRIFLFGTSGSVLRDMRIVLEKVEGGALDTNLSVDAVSGMAGAIAGIRAVENRTMAGKIIVYPALHDMGLIPLDELADRYPEVAAQLNDGVWTDAAEAALLSMVNDQ